MLQYSNIPKFQHTEDEYTYIYASIELKGYITDQSLEGKVA